jgi:hypothetical protein
MEQKSTSLWKSAVTYGIYIGIVSIVVSVIFYATGNTFSQAAQWVGIIVTIAAIVLVQINHRKSLGGFMTYGQALGIAVLSMLFASILSGIYQFVLTSYIDPSLQEQTRQMTEQRIAERGNLSQEQIDMAVNMYMKFQKPAIMLISSIFMGPIMGLVIGLITSIFTKKNPAEPVE